MDLTKWKDKIIELFSKFKAVLPGPRAKANRSGEHSTKFTAALKNLFYQVKEKIESLLNRFLERFPEGKRRPILFGLGGLLVFFFIFIIAALAVNSGKPKKSTVQDLAAGLFIPVEDLFIPSEPEFLPQFIPEREPRQFWSLDDIRPYWKSPGNPELWQEEIKLAIDKLMEGIP